MSNEVLECFQKFLRERKGGPAVNKDKLAELLEAFEVGTKFGIDQAFKTMRGGLSPEQVKGLAQETRVQPPCTCAAGYCLVDRGGRTTSKCRNDQR